MGSYIYIYVWSECFGSNHLSCLLFQVHPDQVLDAKEITKPIIGKSKDKHTWMYVRLGSTSIPQISMSDFYVVDICPFFEFSNRHPILKSMVVSHFLKLTLTNESAIDLRIWTGNRFENTLRSDWFQIMTSLDADLSLNADLSLSCILCVTLFYSQLKWSEMKITYSIASHWSTSERLNFLQLKLNPGRFAPMTCSPRKVSRFAPLNCYYIIIDEVFFDNFLIIIYLLASCCGFSYYYRFSDIAISSVNPSFIWRLEFSKNG